MLILINFMVIENVVGQQNTGDTVWKEFTGTYKDGVKVSKTK